MKHVVIRVDASSIMGTGHVMRCLTLAEALKKNNMNVTFISRPHKGNLIHVIESLGFKVAILPEAIEIIHNKNDKTWLGCTQTIDAKQCIVELQKYIVVDYIIADHYAIDEQWHNLIKPYCNKLIVIDDLANRKYDCDALIDQTLQRHENDYNNLIPNRCDFLLGQNYILLREEFISQKANAIHKRQTITPLNKPDNILVTMGGSDPENVTEKVIDSLVLTKHHIVKLTAIIVMSGQSKHLSSIRRKIEKHTWLTLVIDTNRMASLMVDADIAIGGSGSTAWERCYLGLPCLTIVIADNQKVIANSLSNVGAAINLGESELLLNESLSQQLINLISNNNSYHTMVKNCLSFCDGNGIQRILKEVFNDI